MSAFTTPQNYKTLSRVFKMYHNWIARMSSLENFQYHEKQLLIYLKGKDPVRKSLYQKELEILNSLDQNNDEIENLITREIRSKLLV